VHGRPFENAFHSCHVILIVSLPCEAHSPSPRELKTIS
jgi:hypothetical protein